MAESEFNEHFFSQFLDDYFAEADEHLRSVRRHLLEFEDSLNAGNRIQDRTLNELFRSFHTLKGISAMANVSAAETLAHYMEGYLRMLRDGQSSLSANGLSVLIDSTKKIEEVVLARRNDTEIPNIESEVERLGRETYRLTALIGTSSFLHRHLSWPRVRSTSTPLERSSSLWERSKTRNPWFRRVAKSPSNSLCRRV